MHHLRESVDMSIMHRSGNIILQDHGTANHTARQRTIVMTTRGVISAHLRMQTPTAQSSTEIELLHMLSQQRRERPREVFSES